MSFRGDRAVAATVGGSFSTSVNGILTALLGTPSLNVYKRGSSTPSTAGVTLNVSVNSVVGLNSWVVDTSADGSFYVAGDFDVCIAAGTIGGSSAIGMVVDGFSLNSSVTSQVTGNVAGNVVGSVASVTARVTANVDQIDGAAWSTHVSGMAPADLRDIRGSASVGAAGYVGIDWAQIANPTAVEALTNTTTSSTAPTVAQIATAVWQDTTAGDFTVASSIGKSLYTAGVVPGAAGGLFIAGTNAAVTVNFTGSLSGSVGSVTSRVTANVDQIDGAAWSTHAVGMAPGDLRDILGSASVGSAGHVGIDWAQIANPTATVALTNTTISGGSIVTPAAIASAVWQDVTPGDFTVVGSIGYSLYTGVVPGSQNGIFIAGNNFPINVTITGTFNGSVKSVIDPVRVQQDQQMPGAARWSKPT